VAAFDVARKAVTVPAVSGVTAPVAGFPANSFVFAKKSFRAYSVSGGAVIGRASRSGAGLG
jgi:hypothetical protein